jgi:glycosyltransferase involved in cell wall biosynthesis
MISVISIISNKKIAKEFLLRGLSRQDTKFESILIDNTRSFYKSSSQAYNSGSTKASGDYLMFIHQDVILPTNNWLKEAENWLSTLSSFGLAGVAGMLKPKYINEFELCARYYLLKELDMLSFWYRRFGRGNVFHGRNKLPWEGKPISEIVSVQTVDEQLLIVPSNVFDHIQFDETVCNSWHLHGVEYSLVISEKGYKVYVLPCPAFHLSTGKTDKSYYETLTKIIKKHKHEKVINTTCGLWLTNQKLTEFLFYKSKKTPISKIVGLMKKRT